MLHVSLSRVVLNLIQLAGPSLIHWVTRALADAQERMALTHETLANGTLAIFSSRYPGSSSPTVLARADRRDAREPDRRAAKEGDRAAKEDRGGGKGQKRSYHCYNFQVGNCTRRGCEYTHACEWCGSSSHGGKTCRSCPSSFRY